MKKLPLIICILSIQISFAQNSKEYLIAFTDTINGEELIGYKDRFGKTVINAEFQRVFTDKFYSMAIVVKNGELVGIDPKNNIVLKPFIYDNGPDEGVEGLFRFVENNRIGFANLEGQKIIKAKYSFATPFENGIANYTLGGHREYEKGGEHWWWTDGYERGFVNHQGQEFARVTELKNNKREAWTKTNKHYLLDEKGKIILRLKQ